MPMWKRRSVVTEHLCPTNIANGLPLSRFRKYSNAKPVILPVM